VGAEDARIDGYGAGAGGEVEKKVNGGLRMGDGNYRIEKVSGMLR
jgi:hypothetical protein